jgi:hypothetical protein
MFLQLRLQCWAQLGLLLTLLAATTSASSHAGISNAKMKPPGGVRNAPRTRQAQLVDASELPCPANSANLERQVVLHLEGNAIQDIELSSLQAIVATSFLSTYNSLRFVACDSSHFRSVNAANIAETPPILTTSSTTASAQASVAIALAVEAICHNCTEHLPLFDLSSKEPLPDNFSNPTGNGQLLQDMTPPIESTVLKCMCDADALKWGYGITLQDFLPLFNGHLVEELLVLANEGAVTASPQSIADITVTQMQELQEFQCSDDLRPFKSLVHVELQVNETAPLSERDLLNFEETFKQVYNRLAFDSCDVYQRVIVTAKLDLQVDAAVLEQQERQGHDRNLQQTPSSVNRTTTRGQGSARIAITGNCRNCPVSETGSFTLFDDALQPDGRRRIQQVDNIPFDAFTTAPSPENNQEFVSFLENNNDNFNGMANGTTTCLCPAGSPEPILEHQFDNDTSHQQVEAVTKDEFIVEFMTELQQHASSPPALVSLIEGQQVMCPSIQSTFQTQVFSQLTVDLTSITLQEVRELEQGFVEAYNDLAFQSCDYWFRQVVAVELHIGSNATTNAGRRLQDVLSGNVNSSILGNIDYTSPNRTEMVPTLFDVTGSCRNCPVTDNGQFYLFDDTLTFQNGRNLLENIGVETTLLIPQGRKLQLVNENGTCVCPAGQEPMIGRGPNTELFSSALILEYNQLEEQGILTSTTTPADNVVEGHQVACNGQQVEFKTTLMAYFDLDPNTLSDVETLALEDIFARTYNGKCS